VTLPQWIFCRLAPRHPARQSCVGTAAVQHARAGAEGTKLVEGQWAPRVRIAGGYLEQVIKKRDHPAREPLLWQNAYFGRGRRTIRLRGGFISVNSPLLHTGHLIEEIRKLAYIPEGVVKAYRENVWKGANAGKKRGHPRPPICGRFSSRWVTPTIAHTCGRRGSPWEVVRGQPFTLSASSPAPATAFALQPRAD
jgi:hypothetical protein